MTPSDPTGPRSLPGLLPGPGLCGACRHVRTVLSGKGSTFYLCERSRTDPRFPRYPPMPVVRCSGFEEGPSQEASGGDDPAPPVTFQD